MRFDGPALKDSRQSASILGDFLSVAQCKRGDFPQRHNVLGVSAHFPIGTCSSRPGTMPHVTTAGNLMSHALPVAIRVG
jgi:hypothetical protein